MYCTKEYEYSRPLVLTCTSARPLEADIVALHTTNDELTYDACDTE